MRLITSFPFPANTLSPQGATCCGSACYKAGADRRKAQRRFKDLSGEAGGDALKGQWHPGSPPQVDPFSFNDIVDLTLEEYFWCFNSCFLTQNGNWEALRPLNRSVLKGLFGKCGISDASALFLAPTILPTKVSH